MKCKTCGITQRAPAQKGVHNWAHGQCAYCHYFGVTRGRGAAVYRTFKGELGVRGDAHAIRRIPKIISGGLSGYKIEKELLKIKL